MTADRLAAAAQASVAAVEEAVLSQSFWREGGLNHFQRHSGEPETMSNGRRKIKIEIVSVGFVKIFLIP